MADVPFTLDEAAFDRRWDIGRARIVPHISFAEFPEQSRLPKGELRALCQRTYEQVERLNWLLGGSLGVLLMYDDQFAQQIVHNSSNYAEEPDRLDGSDGFHLLMSPVDTGLVTLDRLVGFSPRKLKYYRNCLPKRLRASYVRYVFCHEFAHAFGITFRERGNFDNGPAKQLDRLADAVSFLVLCELDPTPDKHKLLAYLQPSELGLSENASDAVVRSTVASWADEQRRTSTEDAK